VPVPELLKMSVESFVEKRILFFDHSGLNTALCSLKFEFVLSKHFLRILGAWRQNFGTRMRALSQVCIDTKKRAAKKLSNLERDKILFKNLRTYSGAQL
jgi:hypothetical protein